MDDIGLAFSKIGLNLRHPKSEYRRLNLLYYA